MATVAIVGASGLVGSKLTEILADKLPNHKLVLYGNTTVGQKLCYFGKTYTVQDVAKLPFDRPDYAMFMANEKVSKEFAPLLVSNGTVCIDNSSAFRLNENVPLVVAQINGHQVGCCKLIANPNCTTIQIVIALHALQGLKLRAVTVATYQAASGAGKEGLDDLLQQRSYGKLKSFLHPLCDNVIAQIGSVQEDGFTTEERKIRDESRKILNLPRLEVNSFCARVPVTVGHCAFVNVKTECEFCIEQVRELLKAEKDVLLFDDCENGLFPMPSVLRHTHFVGVGRLHKDDIGNGLNMFVVADNLLRGAAYNAYQILETSMKNNGDWL